MEFLQCNKADSFFRHNVQFHWKKNMTILAATKVKIGTLSNDDGSENVGKKMNLRSFKLHRVYLDPLNMSNASDFSWS